MIPDYFGLLIVGILLVAFLYSSVGHGGASGYIAVMSLLNLAPDSIKPLALTLNILVSSIAAWQFIKAGYFSWSLFWPFAILSVPLAFAGGYITLPAYVFELLVGCILILSALRFLMWPPEDRIAEKPSNYIAVAAGGGIGFLAGLTGTGGGIFLTPLLLFMQWSNTKTAAAISALFVMVNSIAGLFGNITGTQHYPAFALALVAAAVVGGTLGSYFGSRHFDPHIIKRLLALVLLIAGTKLVFNF